MTIKLFTLGFTNKSAEKFFGLLRESGTKRLIDVRLNNISQLAGFAKKQDLAYFLREICDIDYIHAQDLAPTKSMLDDYKKGANNWSEYERKFRNLMEQRQIESTISPELIKDACFLCSEHQPHFCHRRVVAEYLQEHWAQEIQIEHLI